MIQLIFFQAKLCNQKLVFCTKMSKRYLPWERVDSASQKRKPIFNFKSDFSSCHRLGKPRSDGKPRQAIVRFLTRRKRDALYQARFNLKGKEAYKGLFINEDLTSMRYAVLSRAKEAPHVTRVSTNFGNIICKLQTGEQKVLRNPDDVFEVGIDNVDYSHFRLQVIT